MKFKVIRLSRLAHPESSFGIQLAHILHRLSFFYKIEGLQWLKRSTGLILKDNQPK